MKHTFKTKCLVLVLLFTLICSSLLLGGCSVPNDDEQAKDVEQMNYIGTYRSTFVDAQNKYERISFTLTINSDKTFVLTRYTGDSMQEYSGYYKSYTESGKEQLLFIVEENNLQIWTPYFSACFLDDGTLMATAGTTSSSASGIVSAFGSGWGANITLILFAKE